MIRHHIFGTMALAAVFVSGGQTGWAGPLVSEATAARYGLQRAWYAQVRLDRARERVTYLRLIPAAGSSPETLFVQTDRATVHAVDAETGQTLWTRTVGLAAHPTLPVGANDELVAVVNGTTLYLLQRSDGRTLRKDRVDGVPVGGVVLSRYHAFVPMFDGRVMAYRVEKDLGQAEEEETPKTSAEQAQVGENEGEKNAPAQDAPPAVPKAEPPADGNGNGSLSLAQEFFPPLTCVSFGRMSTQPILMRDDDAGEYLAWSTTRGLFVGHISSKQHREFTLEYQLATDSEIVSQPTFLPPRPDLVGDQGIVFTASEHGEICATMGRHGTTIWKYTIGEPILEPVVPIERRVYVATQLGGMYCLAADTGQKHWWTTRAARFVAASKARVYAAAALGRLLLLDAETGAIQDTMDTSALPLKLHNLWTDRLYLATEMGLGQCLHEVELPEPIRHRKPISAAAKPAPTEAPAPEASPETPPEVEDPFKID